MAWYKDLDYKVLIILVLSLSTPWMWLDIKMYITKDRLLWGRGGSNGGARGKENQGVDGRFKNMVKDRDIREMEKTRMSRTRKWKDAD